MEKVKKNSLSECTTIVVGGKLTGDGSRIYARSEDFDAMRCRNGSSLTRPTTGRRSLSPTTALSNAHCLRSVSDTRRSPIISIIMSGEVPALILLVSEKVRQRLFSVVPRHWSMIRMWLMDLLRTVLTTRYCPISIPLVKAWNVWEP